MKLTSDDVLDYANDILDAKRHLEHALADAKRMLKRADLPEPHDRFELAWSMADAIESDISLAGDVGLAISDVVEAMEALADELPND